jgi:hypothetical protein
MMSLMQGSRNTLQPACCLLLLLLPQRAKAAEQAQLSPGGRSSSGAASASAAAAAPTTPLGKRTTAQPAAASAGMAVLPHRHKSPKPKRDSSPGHSAASAGEYACRAGIMFCWSSRCRGLRQLLSEVCLCCKACLVMHAAGTRCRVAHTAKTCTCLISELLPLQAGGLAPDTMVTFHPCR